jgi:putative hydrolase of the HAD superfamily
MLQLSKIRAITLDLDDTLWPVLPTLHRAEVALQDWLVHRAPKTATLFKDAQQRLVLRQAAHARFPDRQHDLSAIRLESIRIALAQSAEDETLASAAFEVFIAARMVVTFYDDALEGLGRLARKFPLLAVSNGNADVHRVGIGQHFVGSVSARDAGVAKPDPHIFLTAARTLQLHPEQVLHVGDDAHLDVLGAMESGMQAVWINRDAHPWQHAQTPHAVATDMLELCALLKV